MIVQSLTWYMAVALCSEVRGTGPVLCLSNRSLSFASFRGIFREKC